MPSTAWLVNTVLVFPGPPLNVSVTGELSVLIRSPFWSSIATTATGFSAAPVATFCGAWRKSNCTPDATVPPSESKVTVPKGSASGKIRDQFPVAGFKTSTVT